MSGDKHTDSLIEVTSTDDLMLFLQPLGSNDILAHFGGDNDFMDAARMAVCWNALAGIADPEAFMRDVLEYAELTTGDSHTRWKTRRNAVRKHLKGGTK